MSGQLTLHPQSGTVNSLQLDEVTVDILKLSSSLNPIVKLVDSKGKIEHVPQDILNLSAPYL